MLYLKIDKVIYKEIPYNGEPLLPILQREGEQGWDFVEQFQTMKHNALALDPRQAMQLVLTLCFKKYLYVEVPGFEAAGVLENKVQESSETKESKTE
jgi:hypothetical protein